LELAVSASLGDDGIDGRLARHCDRFISDSCIQWLTASYYAVPQKSLVYVSMDQGCVSIVRSVIVARVLFR